MKKRTISDIVAVESLSSKMDSQKISNLKKLKQRHYTIANENLFDFFRKKKEEAKDKPSAKYVYKSPKDHYTELMNSDSVSIHLKTTSVDDEIKFMEELIHSGIPFLIKDIERMIKCFKFIMTNGLNTIDKLDKLVDISYFNNSYKYDDRIKAVRFNTFNITVDGLAPTKDAQAHIGSSTDLLELERYPSFTQKYGSDLSKEEVNKYERMYFLNEAIPTLDMIVPVKLASSGQVSVTLNKGDAGLEKLLKLNIELIEKCDHFSKGGEAFDDFRELCAEADEKSHPVPVKSNFGLENLWGHSTSYMGDIEAGFEDHFIKHYTAR
jgi:hypothetical protein